MPYYPYFSLEKVFQDAFEIYILPDEEQEDDEEEMEEEGEEIEEEEEEMEEEEEEEEEEGEEEDYDDEEEEEGTGEEEEIEVEEVEEELEEEEIEGDIEEVEEEEEVEQEEYEEEIEEEEWESIDGDTVSFTLSATLKISLPSCPSPPSTFSSHPLIWGNPSGMEESVAWMMNISQSHQSLYTFTACSNLDEEYSSQEEESLNTFSWRKRQNQKVTELVNLLILKYRKKEPIKKVEMLTVVPEDYENQFPIIFEEASKCLEMIFGIDIKENDAVSSSYVLTNTLGLTYEDTMTDNQRLPRNGFLIVILGVIFIEGNCASEESMWEFLNMMGIYDGKEHFIYGEPREFLTIDLVHQNYLKYQQVPKSYPPRYQFLWGPRAYSETTKMKVLEFLAKLTSRAPTHFSSLYSEAFRDEEGRAGV
ncbi:melanoma-associated antigen 1-like [Rattus rattus]|uniref:melanoma-associated antigen 1-like n=1 Tax=Rattus rattus TaxID=10117 RepID=UPI0013F34D3E|nr:melanoma-associated antigen 1-like [Rattus rattus]